MRKIFASEAHVMDFAPPLLRLQDSPPNPLGGIVLKTLLGSKRHSEAVWQIA